MPSDPKYMENNSYYKIKLNQDMKMILLCSQMELSPKSKLILSRKLSEDLWIQLLNKIKKDRLKNFINKSRKETNLSMGSTSLLCFRNLKKESLDLSFLLDVSMKWKSRNFMSSRLTASQKSNNTPYSNIFLNKKIY